VRSGNVGQPSVGRGTPGMGRRTDPAVKKFVAALRARPPRLDRGILQEPFVGTLKYSRPYRASTREPRTPSGFR